MNLEDLRNNVTDEQKSLLDEIWNHFVQTGTWIVAGALYRKFGKEQVKSILKNLGGSIVYTMGSLGERDRYAVTFLGALLTTKGASLVDIFLQFLEHVKEQLESNLEITDIDVTEAERKLGFNEMEIAVFDNALRISPFRNNINLYAEKKTIGLPKHIDDLLSVNEVGAYFNAQVLADYDAHTPTEFTAIIQPRNEEMRKISLNAEPYLSINLSTEENMAYRYDIFLSYSSEDSEEAEQIHDAIGAAGGKVFLSKKTLKAGDDFASQIRNAIRTSKELWMLVTPNSVKSEWVISEWGAAWALEKKIIPILLHCQPEQAPDRIRRLQCTDFHQYPELIKDRFQNK